MSSPSLEKTTAMLSTHGKRDGHSFGAPAMNSAGAFYTVFVTVYTGLLLYGLGLLWLHRRKTAILIRGLLITSAAVLSIHIYVAAIFIVYPLNGWYKCGTEFWYMSLIFPLAIALFQASNVRLMAYSKIQVEMLQTHRWAEKTQPCGFSLASCKRSFRQMDYVRKTYVCIIMGLAVQVMLTCILFFGSKRFNPSSGFFGHHVDAAACRRGAEWIPSVAWQCVWSWIIGPYILYKTRSIRDTHHWAWQTRLAILAGLPGTPMWLAFLYLNSASLATFNKWWPPVMWFAPGLMTMQITAVFVPLYDVYRYRATTWSERSKSTCSTPSTSRAFSAADFSRENSGDIVTGYAAFESQLKHNIEPLLVWAATRDFTVENVQFLKEVRDFKRRWQTHVACSPVVGLLLSQVEQRAMYEDAARIYFELVCPGTSQLYINVDSKTFYDLEQMFKGLRYEPPLGSEPAHTVQLASKERLFHSETKCEGRSISESLVTPWKSPTLLATAGSIGSHVPFVDLGQKGTGHEIVRAGTINPSASDKHCNLAIGADPRSAVHTPDIIHSTGTPPVRSRAKILSTMNSASAFYNPYAVPQTFGLKVFDKAEESVKYLVYTNTWKTFVAGVEVESIASYSPFRSRDKDTLIAGLEVAGFDGERSGVADVQMKQPRDGCIAVENPHEQDMTEGFVTEVSTYHGVLDDAAGDVDMTKVDGRCMACRKKANLPAHRNMAVTEGSDSQ